MLLCDPSNKQEVSGNRLTPNGGRVSAHQASNFTTRFTGFMKPVNLNLIVQHKLIIVVSIATPDHIGVALGL